MANLTGQTLAASFDDVLTKGSGSTPIQDGLGAGYFYEEGTFTPVLADASTGGNVATFLTRNGRYTKIGTRVFFQITLIDINTSGMTSGNQVFVRGLPYPSANLSSNESYFIIQGSNITSPSGIVIAYMTANIDYLPIFNNLINITNFTVSQITSGTGDIRIAGNYISA